MRLCLSVFLSVHTYLYYYMLRSYVTTDIKKPGPHNSCLVPFPCAAVQRADPRDAQDLRQDVRRVRVQLRLLYGPRQNYQR